MSENLLHLISMVRVAGMRYGLRNTRISRSKNLIAVWL